MTTSEQYGKLDQFLANLYGTGLARPSRFEVLITPPASASGAGFSALGSTELLRHLSITCETAEIPSQTISTNDLMINGLPVIPVPGSFSFSNQLTLTFKLSQDFRERNFLLAWQHMIFVPGVGFNYYNNYVGTIVLRPLNGANMSTQEIVFRNCFPITINDLQFNWGQVNDNLKQSATFSFFSMETRVTGKSESTWGHKQGGGAISQSTEQELQNRVVNGSALPGNFSGLIS